MQMKKENIIDFLKRNEFKRKWSSDKSGNWYERTWKLFSNMQHKVEIVVEPDRGKFWVSLVMKRDSGQTDTYDKEFKLTKKAIENAIEFYSS